ncbi:MAG: UDP-N-acetylglucosamine 2-epimerase [Parcubacteria group bacterium]|nr:UDP-N-acetylglucosamine 2-epimerase [Parcubacteria group bacterium]
MTPSFPSLLDPAISYREDLFTRTADHPAQVVHLLVVGTKPDIIKMMSLVTELRTRGELLVVGHTGQHYGYNLSDGVTKEFGMVPDFNLNIRGSLHERLAQIITRLGTVVEALKTTGKTIVPYIHGDTLTAFASAVACYQSRVAVVHIEAGVRSLTPRREFFDALTTTPDISQYMVVLKDIRNWERGTIEPFPEQFNTRSIAATAALHCAPTSLCVESLRGEGMAIRTIALTGNTVVDAVDRALAVAESSNEVFMRFPSFTKGFIFMTIHRRENVSSFHKVRTILTAIEQLVAEGRTVWLVSFEAWKYALAEFGLTAEVEEYAKKHPNFVISDPWPHHGSLMRALKKASTCIVTDSGSMQEEADHLDVPCVTIRFNTDRLESVLAGANLLAPPIDPELLVSFINYADDNEAMRGSPHVYGENVAPKIVERTLSSLKDGELFRWEHEVLEFHKNGAWQKGEVTW